MTVQLIKQTKDFVKVSDSAVEELDIESMILEELEESPIKPTPQPIPTSKPIFIFKLQNPQSSDDIREIASFLHQCKASENSLSIMIECLTACAFQFVDFSISSRKSQFLEGKILLDGEIKEEIILDKSYQEFFLEKVLIKELNRIKSLVLLKFFRIE